MSIFSRNLYYLRKKYELGQPELASRLGYKSYTTIQKWEDGSNEPYAATLKSIADLFNVTMEDLYNHDLSNPDSSSYSSADQKLLSLFRQLNQEGQEKATDYVEDLLASGRYIKTDTDQLVEEKAT